MRIALIYPPPWEIPEPGAQPDSVDGPPEGYRPGDLDGDFYQMPYGLTPARWRARCWAHHPEIDTVTTGESELTFLELCERLSRRAPMR